MLVQELLKKQATQYQKHMCVIKKTQATLDHQYRTQLHGTIPKKHKPLPPTVINTNGNKEKFNKEFLRQYQELFFKSLQDAITKNTITLELEKARCTDVLRQTERELCQLTEPGPALQKLYAKFLKDLLVTNHEILPELKKKFESQNTPETQTSPTTSKIQHSPTPTSPEPLPKATQVRTHTSSQKHFNRKRKNNTPIPATTKQMKLDSFLVPGPKPPKTPI